MQLSWTYILLGALCSAVGIVSLPSTAWPQAAGVSFAITYNDTEGQVGHHMVAWPGAKCPGGWQSDPPEVISGNLPPGLKIIDAEITGTPTQPGRWSVALQFGTVECNGATYSNVTTRINFNIKGIAPRPLPP